MAEISPYDRRHAFHHPRVESASTVTETREVAIRNPELYHSVIDSLYTPESLQKIEQTLGRVPTPDDMRGIVLAEPENDYDRELKHLSREEKQTAYYDQIDTTAELCLKLSNYLADHMHELDVLPDKTIYEDALKAVLGDTDTKLTQNQRQSARLSVVNFIEDRKTFQAMTVDAHDHPKEFSEELMRRSFQDNVDVDVFPFAVIIYLSTSDFNSLAAQPNGRNVTYLGLTAFGNSLPAPLIGKTILINKEYAESEGLDVNETVIHELTHVLFKSYIERESLFDLEETDAALSSLETIEDHKHFARQLRESVDERYKDEVLAYATTNDFYPTVHSLGIYHWAKSLSTIQDFLAFEFRGSPQEKRKIYDLYYDEFRSTLKSARDFSAISFWLLGQENGLSIEKATALLQTIPPDKAVRLGHFVGVEPDELRRYLSSELERASHEFVSDVERLNSIVERGDVPLSENTLFWEDAFEEKHDLTIFRQYPLQALQGFTEIVAHVNSPMYVQASLEAVETLILLHKGELTNEQYHTIVSSIDSLLTNRTADEYQQSRVLAENIKRVINHRYIPDEPDFSLPVYPESKVYYLLSKDDNPRNPSMETLVNAAYVLRNEDEEVWIQAYPMDDLKRLVTNEDGLRYLLEAGNTWDMYGIGKIVDALLHNENYLPKKNLAALRDFLDAAQRKEFTLQYDEDVEELEELHKKMAHLHQKLEEQMSPDTV